MKSLFHCLLVVVCIGSGCRKRSKPAAVAPVAPVEQAPTVSEKPQTKVIAPSPSDGPVKPSNLPPDVEFESSTAFRELSTGLQLFVSDKKRFPNTLQEIKAAGYLPNGIPTPPPGIRLVIDQKTKTVQAVR